MYDSILVWFRRDLRDHDHAALSEALRRGRSVFCVFVFDTDILNRLPRRVDRRVDFIFGSLLELDERLRARGGSLILRHGRSVEEIPRLALSLGVQAVFANRDYEPATVCRDHEVKQRLGHAGIEFADFKDQVIFDRLEVLTPTGSVYKVFTPYKKAWLARLGEGDLIDYPTSNGTLATPPDDRGPTSLDKIGFAPSNLSSLGVEPGMQGARYALARFLQRIDQYGVQRDYPCADAGSRLSVHLRFGTISIREIVTQALARGASKVDTGAAVWLSELIWRDFFFMISCRIPPSDRARVQAGLRRDRLGIRAISRVTVRSLVRRRNGVPSGRCRDAPTQRYRLYAQPPAHGRGLVPVQGSGDRLAPRRSLLRRAPARFRPRCE